jgi:hypothetical protein
MEGHQQKLKETESFVILSRPWIHFDFLKWIKIDRDTAQYVVLKWNPNYRLQRGDLSARSLENGFCKEGQQQKSEETERCVILSRPRIHLTFLYGSKLIEIWPNMWKRNGVQTTGVRAVT